jgi:hypothetical protein
MIFGVSTPVVAGGLAYRLPADGEWVKYQMFPGEYSLERLTRNKGGGVSAEKVELPKPKKKEDFFLVRSVGTVRVDGEVCRWIELVNEPQQEGKEKPACRLIILKLLIPEAAFRPDVDALVHVKKMYMSDRHEDGTVFVDEVKDLDRRNYEIERFRALFPVPPAGARRSDEIERKTALGPAKGYELEFEYGFEGKLFAGKRGLNRFKGRYKVFVSDRAPFGLMEAVLEHGEGLEDTGQHINKSNGSGCMRLVESGNGATSGLPGLK